jgi:beta-phosphoglucomutase
MQRAVIFDLDGVLVDSYQAHFDSWQRLCRKWNLTMTERQFASTFGRTTREVVAQFWSARALSPVDVANLDAEKEAIFRQLLSDDFPIMDGALVLLDDLHDAGVLIGLGSSAPPENVWMSLDRLNRRDHFAAVVTGADVIRGKPDPEVFLLCAERMKVPPPSCVVIEDAPAGIAAAQAAGMTCVALASRGRTRDELAKANCVVDNLNVLSARYLLESIG